MEIFLLGFMGSGKSTFGRKLAAALELDFFDLDKLVEERAKCSVNDIFKYLGEDTFRQMESDCLKSFEDKEHFVLATGGGTPCFFDNMEFIRSKGKSIYMELDEKVLFSRLSKAKSIRPSIRGLNEQELRDFIHTTLEKREAIYRMADLTINGMSLRTEPVIELLLG